MAHGELGSYPGQQISVSGNGVSRSSKLPEQCIKTSQKQCLTDDNDVLPQDIIQQELAKVIQIEVGMLKEMERLESFSPQLLASTRDDLSLWHQQLPHWMSLDVLIEAHELARNTRWTIFLVHLFYLSAYVLLARLAYEPEDDRFTETEQARTAISDGVLAARTAARILKLQLDERAIFQRCWLCEYVLPYNTELCDCETNEIVSQIHSIHILSPAFAQRCLSKAQRTSAI